MDLRANATLKRVDGLTDRYQDANKHTTSQKHTQISEQCFLKHDVNTIYLNI